MSQTTGAFRVLIAAIVIGTMTLTGCASSPDKPRAQNTTDTQDNTADGDAPAAEAEAPGVDPADVVQLPANFPDSVPLHPGPITSATSMTMGGDTGYWDIHVRTSDSAAAMNEVRAQLVEAGFAEDRWSEVGMLVSGVFTTPELRVAVQTAKDIDGEMLMYTVNEL